MHHYDVIIYHWIDYIRRRKRRHMKKKVLTIICGFINMNHTLLKKRLHWRNIKKFCQWQIPLPLPGVNYCDEI